MKPRIPPPLPLLLPPTRGTQIVLFSAWSTLYLVTVMLHAPAWQKPERKAAGNYMRTRL